MEKKNSLIPIISTIFKYRKFIFKVTIAAFILSAIISLWIMPVYYKASTTYYVASSDLQMPDPVGNRLKEKEFYGLDADIDINLTIANSKKIKNYITEKYNLFEHYDIDKNNAKADFYLNKHFTSLYKIKRTKYDAIQITLEDKDPELAYKMLKEIINQISNESKAIIRKGQIKISEATLKGLEESKRHIQVLSDSLKIIRSKFGIYNTLMQSELLTSMESKLSSSYEIENAKMEVFQSLRGGFLDSIPVIKARLKGLSAAKSAIAKKLEKFNSGFTEVEILEDLINASGKQYNIDLERYKHLKKAILSENPALFVVEEAEIPVVKSRPIRWLVVAVSTMVAFLFVIFGVLIFDFYRGINWSQVLKDS